jgi:hypothetical protein
MLLQKNARARACRAIKILLTAGVIAAASSPWLSAQQQAFTREGTGQPPPAVGGAAATNATESSNTLEKILNGETPGFIGQGKFNLNVRLRYEQDDVDNVPGVTKNSYVPTVRTRFGYTTGSVYGFQGMLEGVNTSVFGSEQNYNAAGSNHEGSRPSVGDPPLTRFDQAWAGYTNTNYVNFSIKGGQQQIDLDNQRFVGDAGWRQNMQTFESISGDVSPLKDLRLYYCYIWNVDRVYGDVSELPAANQDFNSRSHLVNVSYSGWEYGRFVGYAYLLDLWNAAGKANSCATYGGYFAGAAPVCDKVMLDYRAEFAWQDQYAENPKKYDADYVNAEFGANIKPFAFGTGYELLGSGANTGAGGGRVGFNTPLESPHPFNGWAEQFVTHPANGLQDIYEYAQVTLPWKTPFRFVYHKYYSDVGGTDCGQEFDAMITHKFGKYFSALVEFANYLGEPAAPPSVTAAHVNVQKFWAAVEFNF